MSTHAPPTPFPRLPEGRSPPLALPEHTGESDPDIPTKRSNDEQGDPERGSQKKHGKNSGKWLVIIGIAITVLTGVVVLTLVLVSRHRSAHEEHARKDALAKGPKLEVVRVEKSRQQRELSLPGEVRGFNQATLYAKVSGYVSEIRVDRGDHVKKGDVLAVVEAPEVRDDLLSAQSNREFTRRTAARLDILAPSVVSAIDRDTAVNAAKMADANLRRAKVVYDYTIVRAPFDGVITARYVDLGALVPAATTATQQAQPVVDMAELDRVRVFTYLGQDAAAFVKAGDPVAIYSDERPEQRVPAQMTRISGALDPRTRTMQCEVDIDNREWHLIPGTFVHVRLALEIPPSPLVPDEALVTRDGAPAIAIVNDDKRVHYVAVEIGNDDGKTTRILNGLQGGETIGLNVPVQIDEGQVIQPMDAKPSTSNEKGDKSARGSPTSTPTSVTRIPPPGPIGTTERNPEPNITSDNGARK